MRSLAIEDLHTPNYSLKLILASFSLLLSLNASATLITFDELELHYDEEAPSWYDNPLTGDEYTDKGVRVLGGYLTGEEPDLSVYASNGASIEFVGDLPNFVSMNVTSAYGDAVFLSFYGESGLLSTITTSGWQYPEEYATPVIPDELISFTATSGIKSIQFSSFWNMRIHAVIDNIHFYKIEVPEPSILVFLCIGLFSLLLRRIRFG